MEENWVTMVLLHCCCCGCITSLEGVPVCGAHCGGDLVRKDTSLSTALSGPR
jgi:hypothetical protein